MDEEDDTIEKAFKYVDINNSGCVSKTVSNVIIDILLTTTKTRTEKSNLRLIRRLTVLHLVVLNKQMKQMKQWERN